MIKLPSKVYDILKWILMIVVDAFIALFTGLASTWGWDIPVDAIVTTIALISAFVGVCVGISTINYNKSKEG